MLARAIVLEPDLLQQLHRLRCVGGRTVVLAQHLGDEGVVALLLLRRRVVVGVEVLLPGLDEHGVEVDASLLSRSERLVLIQGETVGTTLRRLLQAISLQLGPLHLLISADLFLDPLRLDRASHLRQALKGVGRQNEQVV